MHNVLSFNSLVVQNQTNHSGFLSQTFCSFAEVRVTCIFSESCMLPCSFTPNGTFVSIQWYHQESLIFSIQQGGEQLSNGNTWLQDEHFSHGNATLFLKRVDVKSKGRYKCVVNTVPQMYIVVAVEGLYLAFITGPHHNFP